MTHKFEERVDKFKIFFENKCEKEKKINNVRSKFRKSYQKISKVEME